MMYLTDGLFLERDLSSGRYQIHWDGRHIPDEKIDEAINRLRGLNHSGTLKPVMIELELHKQQPKIER